MRGFEIELRDLEILRAVLLADRSKLTFRVVACDTTATVFVEDDTDNAVARVGFYRVDDKNVSSLPYDIAEDMDLTTWTLEDSTNRKSFVPTKVTTDTTALRAVEAAQFAPNHKVRAWDCTN